MDNMTVQSFRQMILHGANQLVAFEKELNAINVFPVADGDTGSNMAYLMRTIMRELTDQGEQSIQKIKLACLRGSRGNSGMILSQFIMTMCDYINQHGKLNKAQFVEMSEQSVTKAVAVVRQPVEGTILTVMRDWVMSMKQQAHHVVSISQLLEQSCKDVMRSLERTMQQMPILKKHHVVDAGAKGFYHFIHGFTVGVASPVTSLSTKQNDVVQPEPIHLQITANEHAATSHRDYGHPFEQAHDQSDNALLEDGEDRHSNLNYRYCTEFMFEGCTQIQALKARLERFGDSLILVGDELIAKIHIHANEPHLIAAEITKEATITFQKVEDMRRQQEMIHTRKSNIALVVDSACDLPQDIMDQYHIHMLPLNISIDQSSYLDKRTLMPEQLYQYVQQGESEIRTSLPSREAIGQLYEQLLRQYELVISIHVSDQLSGTYNACMQVAKEFESSNIIVLNSKSLSGAYGLTVLNFAQQLEQQLFSKSSERLTAEQRQHIVDWVTEQFEHEVSKQEILVTVPSLQSMVKSGRVSPWKGSIASLFNVQPIVSIDEHGASKLLRPSVLRSSNIPKLLKQIKKIHQQNEIVQYVVLYTDKQDELVHLINEMHRLTGKLPQYVTTVSSVIGIYAGSGAYSIAMSLARKNERSYV